MQLSYTPFCMPRCACPSSFSLCRGDNPVLTSLLFQEVENIPINTPPPHTIPSDTFAQYAPNKSQTINHQSNVQNATDGNTKTNVHPS